MVATNPNFPAPPNPHRKRESQGFMYLAKRPCGKVSAMAWDDAGYEKSTAKSVSKWLRRGDKVERVEVFKGDPMPETICRPKCDECKATPNAKLSTGQQREEEL